MTLTLTGWPTVVLSAIVIAYALLGLVYGVTWLLVIKDKYRDPERYANFRMLRNARKRQ